MLINALIVILIIIVKPNLMVIPMENVYAKINIMMIVKIISVNNVLNIGIYLIYIVNNS